MTEMALCESTVTPLRRFCDAGCHLIRQKVVQGDTFHLQTEEYSKSEVDYADTFAFPDSAS